MPVFTAACWEAGMAVGEMEMAVVQVIMLAGRGELFSRWLSLVVFFLGGEREERV